jgi:hypothetical protein
MCDSEVEFETEGRVGEGVGSLGLREFGTEEGSMTTPGISLLRCATEIS